MGEYWIAGIESSLEAGLWASTDAGFRARAVVPQSENNTTSEVDRTEVPPN